ncbi:MAG TPA: hypothetical protein VIU16_03740, partial [Gaiellaceae bacterium]
VEAAVRQHELLAGTPDAALPLIAAARYLAAHAPTARAQRQTYEIAWRLHRGDRLYEEIDEGPAGGSAEPPAGHRGQWIGDATST